jgi:enamine deaminase RidA (YjgF/YER057c/UK114 family)
LLSQQTRDAARDIMKQGGGSQVLKLRAFVAGTGDLRRVPQIISEAFAEKKHLAIPAVSVFQVGRLPLEGAQIAVESISESKQDVNPQGLLFVSAREHSLDQPLQPLAPLAERALADITTKLAGRGQVLRLTCFATVLDEAAAISAAMTARFPGAAYNLVQTQRAPARSSVACDAVARVTADGPGVKEPGVVWVNADRVVLTGTQVAYGFTDDDARLAFRRVDRVLSQFGASTKTAAVVDLFPLSSSIAAQAARLRPEFVDASHSSISTIQRLEGLPGMDASFAIEVVAPAQP